MGVTRRTFQQTDRHPAIHGLSGPLNLTALCSSAKPALCLTVCCHRPLSVAGGRASVSELRQA